MEEKIIEIKPIFTITMLDYFPRMPVFHQERTGFVTIEQEYYAFIQRESVLLTWWFLLNLGTIRATSVERRGIKIKKNRSAELKFTNRYPHPSKI